MWVSFGGVDGGANRVDVGVIVFDVLCVLVVCVEVCDDVFCEGDVGVIIDGDVVVVIEDN